MGRQPFHDFPSSKHYHQNTTPPSALHEVQLHDGMPILRAWHCPPGCKPEEELGKEEKLLPPRRAHMTQDPAKTLQCSGSLYGREESQAGRQAFLPTSRYLR